MSGYRGRFAPSPTGPLHFGSLVAAVASWTDARSAGGEWLVRMEDVDTPRCVAGADRVILDQLRAHGLEWDGEVLYQSTRGEAYQEALDRLAGHTYLCACTRREAGQCRCREGLPPGRKGRAIRVRGEGLVDDFVLKRADGLWAYQLAVVVDDAAQGITHVVRGADLLDSTPRHRHLQRLLDYAHPDYCHVPLALDARGEKLSKQNHAPPLGDDAASSLRAALRFLGHDVPEGTVGEVLRWAERHWSRERLPHLR